MTRQELVNLIDDPACADVANDLRKCLDDHLAATDDPALHDAIPQPSGDKPPWEATRFEAKRARVAKWKNQRMAIQADDQAAHPAFMAGIGAVGHLKIGGEQK